MFRNLIFTFITLSILAFYSIKANAQSMNELDYDYGDQSGAHYYDEDYDETSGYNGTNTFEEMKANENPKYISPQDVDQAIKVYEKYGLSYKQRKQIEKRRKIRQEVDEGKLRPNPIYGSPHALFRIPVTVRLGETIVPAGYYLIDYKVTTENIILFIKEGNRILGSVPAEKVLDQKGKVEESFVVINSMDDENLDITLNTKESLVQVKIPIYKN